MSRHPLDVNVLLDLLKQTATLSSISQYLRDKGLPSSTTSWESTIESRLKPAIKTGSITVLDLYNFLACTEEYGAQHIFLYSCDQHSAQDVSNVKHLKEVLSKVGLIEIFQNPRVVAMPSQPIVTEVRHSDDDERIVIKVVEKRIHMEFIGEEVHGTYVTKKYQKKVERAVNVACLHADGFLELRIASHKNSSKYANDLRAFWDIITQIITKDNFSEISLKSIKERFCSARATLHNEIRFSTSKMLNDFGTTLLVASGSQESDLMDDEGASSSLAVFSDHDAYCDSANIFFKCNHGQYPTADIHVLFGGEINEFAIPARCDQNNYQHVLKRIRSLNS